MDPRLAHELSRAPAISRRDHPRLVGSIDRAVRTGRLVPLLPGTYATVNSFATRVAAVQVWDPDAVFSAGCAARLSWWPDLGVETVTARTRRRPHCERPLFDLCRGLPDPDLVVELRGLRLLSPPASALDLAREMGPGAIDEVLRRRAATLDQLHRACERLPALAGKAAVRRYLRDSRDAPWSALERDAHARLHRSRIRGWKANHPVRVGGVTYYLDIAFEAMKLALELDGWAFHHTRESFVQDRRRDVNLQLAGWTVLRFTADTIDQLVPSVRRWRGDGKRPWPRPLGA